MRGGDATYCGRIVWEIMKALIFVSNLNYYNGVTKCIMNYYDSLIRGGYTIDFLLITNVGDSSIYSKIESNNGKVYSLPDPKKKYCKMNARYISNLLQNTQYDIIHVNVPGSYGVMVLNVSRKSNVKNRIYHSHNPKSNSSVKGLLSATLYDPICKYLSSTRLACSTVAGRSSFGNSNFTVLKNCIESSLFEYNRDIRKLLRGGMEVAENEVLIGFVGRFEAQKNPLFLLDVIRHINIESEKRYKLVMIGDGSLKRKIRAIISQYAMEDCVFLIPPQKNINEWYSAMDIFVLPSLYEGLGIVLLEAQASGLPVFASENVPSDTNVSPLITYLNISDYDKAIMEWASAIENCKIKMNRDLSNKYIIDAGYDLDNEKDDLLHIYNSCVING